MGRTTQYETAARYKTEVLKLRGFMSRNVGFVEFKGGLRERFRGGGSRVSSCFPLEDDMRAFGNCREFAEAFKGMALIPRPALHNAIDFARRLGRELISHSPSFSFCSASLEAFISTYTTPSRVSTAAGSKALAHGPGSVLESSFLVLRRDQMHLCAVLVQGVLGAFDSTFIFASTSLSDCRPNPWQHKAHSRYSSV